MQTGRSEALIFLARYTFTDRVSDALQSQRLPSLCMAGSLLIATVICLPQGSHAQEQVVIDTELEYNVKGAFLYSFGRYTSWPGGIIEKEEDPFIIGVYGDAPITRILRRIEMTKTINGRPVQLRLFTELEETQLCHILFVSRSVPRSDQKLVIQLNQKSAILVVGEIEEFTELGGVARFYIADGSVKFEINLTEARRKRLSFDAKLLRLARVIEPQPQPQS